eukprot:scaffold26818_cov37-Prasinocladus_malaysianus.AAC.1
MATSLLCSLKAASIGIALGCFLQAQLRTPEDVARASLEQVAKALEGGARDRNNPRLLRIQAARILKGARAIVRKQAQELKEQAEAAVAAAQQSCQVRLNGLLLPQPVALLRVFALWSDSRDGNAYSK